MAVTYASIAKASGVSTAAVSLVLRNPDHPEFNPETRRRILNAAKRLNYTPNRVAASLRGGQTKTLGLVMPYHEAELMDIAEQTAAELGYTIMIQFTYKPDLELERKAIRAAMEHRVDGLLWHPARPAGSYGQLPAQLRDFGMKVVFMERRLRHFPQADWVCCDVKQGIRMAIEHLRSRGYRQLVYVTQETNYPLRWWWLKLFRAYCGQDVEVISYPNKPGKAAVKAGLERLADRGPLGIFCDVDWGVMPVQEACEELNLSIPNDAGVIALGDVLVGAFFRVGELCRPQFSAIRRPVGAVAKQCVDLLVDRINGKRTGPGEEFILETELIERQTTKGPVAAGPGETVAAVSRGHCIR